MRSLRVCAEKRSRLDWVRLKVKLNLSDDATSMKLDVLSYKFVANFSSYKYILFLSLFFHLFTFFFTQRKDKYVKASCLLLGHSVS